jgi:hypothetical protein
VYVCSCTETSYEDVSGAGNELPEFELMHTKISSLIEDSLTYHIYYATYDYPQGGELSRGRILCSKRIQVHDCVPQKISGSADGSSKTLQAGVSANGNSVYKERLSCGAFIINSRDDTGLLQKHLSSSDIVAVRL